MRILGVGEYCDLGDMYHRLAEAGHEIRVYIADANAGDVFGGMLDVIPNWQAELDWVRDAGESGAVLFESATNGAVQDALRAKGYQVIGGSALGDRLEADRAYGQQVLRDLGLSIVRSTPFDDFTTAIEFVKASPGRYVFKSNGADTLRSRNYVGEMQSGADMIALLGLHRAQWAESTRPDFVLMDYIDGVEVGVGAYFNGSVFLHPACLDWEHKRFFPGDLGELTGEMGTIVTYRGAERVFELTLARMERRLAASGYCGYINLNLIANEEGLWPLEFTSRFGYPGFAICDALHEESWDSIFAAMLRRDRAEFATRAGYAAGVVLTVPPFPYRHGYAELSKGSPISFRETMTRADHEHLHFAEVALRDGQLVTSGMIGYVGVATGTGETVQAAQAAANALAQKVVVPNVRYRTDIGARLIEHDLARLRRLGYVP